MNSQNNRRGADPLCPVPPAASSAPYVPVAVVGAGPAGLAAARAAKEAGALDVLLIERDEETGGILNQCIHDGFGLLQYGENLTGPEYAWKSGQNALRSGVRILSGAMVSQITPGRVLTVFRRGGWAQYQAGALVLAMGCRERARGAIQLPGQRPAGIFTAGVAQALVNTMNIMIGRKAVVLGSGDIGLIMARRLTLEGMEVAAVLEKLPYPGGLPRNIRQCLMDYQIPLLLSHTVTEVLGRHRVDGVRVCRLDAGGNPVPGTEQIITCDTLILSVGLIPENELSVEAGIALDPSTGGPIVDQYLHTNIPGIFACGNALHVHDLADYAAEEGARAGLLAARYAAALRQSPAAAGAATAKAARTAAGAAAAKAAGSAGSAANAAAAAAAAGAAGAGTAVNARTAAGASAGTAATATSAGTASDAAGASAGTAVTAAAETPAIAASAGYIPVVAGPGVRYVLPQQIRFPGQGESDPAPPAASSAVPAPPGQSPSDTGNKLTFFLRVQAPHANARIVFRIRDQIIHSQSFPKVNPPEMLRVEIPAQKLMEPYPFESLEVCLDV